MFAKKAEDYPQQLIYLAKNGADIKQNHKDGGFNYFCKCKKQKFSKRNVFVQQEPANFFAQKQCT